MHTGPVPGKYVSDWKPISTLTNFECQKCSSKEVIYRVWESDDGGYEDVHYKCKTCGKSWWYESDDA
jgi:DNA-directed RNA polymerase subunit M/transcription elongation factor TFIIS